MQQANEAAILDHVRTNGSVSRSDVARDLGLSPATVTRAVRRLLHTGALREVGLGIPTLGRPPTLLEYNPRQGFVIAVDVGGTACRAILADLEGEELHASVAPTHQAGRDPIDIVYEAVEDALDQARDLPRLGTHPDGPSGGSGSSAGSGSGTRPGPVTALCVGVPGVVSHPEGMVSRCPNVGWDGVPVGRLLKERFDIPVIVENDVNLAALGEAWRGAAQGMADFAVISLGTGIGAGLVVGRELLHGHHYAAGEVAHLVPGTEHLSRPPGDESSACRQGCLESLASGPAIAERAAALLARDSQPSGLWSLKSELHPENTRAGDSILPEDVFRLYHQGDPVATTVIDELVDHMAILSISIAAILDPEIIIFGGSIGLAAEAILPAVAARVEGQVPAAPGLKVSTLGGRATLLGAISAALALARTIESGRAGHTRAHPDASVALAFRSIQTGG